MPIFSKASPEITSMRAFTGVPTISGYSYSKDGYTGPVNWKTGKKIKKDGFTWDYSGFGKGWGWLPKQASQSTPTGIGGQLSSVLDSLPKEYQVGYVPESSQDFAQADTQFKSVMDSFSKEVANILSSIDVNLYNSSIERVKQIQENPDKYLENTGYAKDKESFLNKYKSRLVAEGLNPAETGTGASILQEAAGSFRNKYINDLIANNLSYVTKVNNIQRQLQDLTQLKAASQAKTLADISGTPYADEKAFISEEGSNQIRNFTESLSNLKNIING